MSESSSFYKLSTGVQRWIYLQQWEGLRAIQEQSVPVILAADNDVLITAPTAGGKTEAAFLPVVSYLEETNKTMGFGAICISPLKALINDQFQRLESLCDQANSKITPWHGDIGSSLKNAAWRAPSGILLITPESLEAMFVRRPNELASRISALKYIVIDEFHAFLGRERGQQLLSLLSRIEALCDREICRIALSATIGDPAMALAHLRPSRTWKGVHLDVANIGMDLQLSLKTYSADEKNGIPTSYFMAQDLFPVLRGYSNLVFANSRTMVEEITDQLAIRCEALQMPTEFFAHHGSLSKESRNFVEQHLKRGETPTTAIATSTLELGIDIGDVRSVAQIGAPANVSSVRQRLGRSGRRAGQPSILRVLVSESSCKKKATPIDKLEMELVQSIAIIELMLERWVEPPETHALHLSTLIQQILSMIAFRGGITASVAHKVLCLNGPWRNLAKDMFVRVLRALGTSNVIVQLGDGELAVGEEGEKLLSSHTFYTAFEVPEEFTLVAHGKNIGTLPVDTPYVVGQLLLFGGRRWSVQSIDLEAKVMNLVRAGRGQAPIFGGESAPVHQNVRQRMLDIYQSDREPRFCDRLSLEALRCARKYFDDHDLGINSTISSGGDHYIFIWDNDRVIDAIKIAASLTGVAADRVGPCVTLEGYSETEPVIDWIISLLNEIGEEEIASSISSKPLGKYDHLLTPDILREAFVVEKIDICRARAYLSHIKPENLRGE